MQLWLFVLCNLTYILNAGGDLRACFSTTSSRRSEMQPSSPHHRSLFSVLPPEIIVQILSYTDACTIGRVSASSSCCKAVIDENSQIIYEALAIRHLNATTPCTAGDSGITINSLPAFALEELELDQHSAIAPVARQLQRAIKYQRTSSTAYDNITTWRDFGEC